MERTIFFGGTPRKEHVQQQQCPIQYLLNDNLKIFEPTWSTICLIHRPCRGRKPSSLGVYYPNIGNCIKILNRSLGSVEWQVQIGKPKNV